jgi:hypothetical protein
MYYLVKVLTIVASLCCFTAALPVECDHDLLSLVQSKATVSIGATVSKEKQMPMDMFGQNQDSEEMFGPSEEMFGPSEEMFGPSAEMFGPSLSTQHLANALGPQEMQPFGQQLFGQGQQGQAPAGEMFHNMLTTQHLANALGQQDPSGNPGVFMHSQADSAKEQVRQLALGNDPYPSTPSSLNSAGVMGYQASPPNFHYEASDSPGISQLLSMGGSGTGGVEAQETEIHSAKLAQQQAADEATSFAGSEGAKLAHNLRLKDVLDKFYGETPRATPVANSVNMLSGSSMAAPAAVASTDLYSTDSNALDGSVIQAAVQDAIAKQSLQTSEAAEKSQQKVADTDTSKVQTMLLQKILDTQELLSRKVLALEDAKKVRQW